jgi:hypothetical protein
MAGQAAKKTAERNAHIVASHTIAYLVSLGLYILFKLIYQWSSYSKLDGFWFLLLNSTTIFLYKQMASSGMDLGQEGGLLSFYYDVLYLSWFTMAAVSISSKVYWVLLLIPIFALIKLKSLVSSLYEMLSGKKTTEAKLKKKR